MVHPECRGLGGEGLTDGFDPSFAFHLRPTSGLFGDPKPFYWGGAYHVFFQNSPGMLSFDHMQWAHVVSRDLLQWQRLPAAVVPGSSGPDAFGCWTGSVIEHLGKFFLFYTGCGGPDGTHQTVCLATSDDLVHWHKDPANPLSQPCEPYATGDPQVAWRDPHVVRERDGSFTMILAAQLAGLPRPVAGCVARLTSKDLRHWEPAEPLHAPGSAHKCECPELFTLDGRHYLVYSDYGVQVRSSLCRTGPFEAGAQAHLDDFRYCALKTSEDALGRRLAFAFIFDRRDRSDEAEWVWGGVMALPRELLPADDGGLRMRPVVELEALRRQPLQLAPDPTRPYAGDWTVVGETIVAQRVKRSDEWSFVLLGYHPQGLEFVVDIQLTANGRGGVMIGVDEPMTQGYAVEIDTGRNTLTLKRLQSTRNTASLELQHVALPVRTNGDTRYRLHCFLDADVLEVFVDEKTSLSARVYACANQGEARSLGLCFSGSDASFSALTAYRLGPAAAASRGSTTQRRGT